jgi:hypothetical protein
MVGFEIFALHKSIITCITPTATTAPTAPCTPAWISLEKAAAAPLVVALVTAGEVALSSELVVAVGRSEVGRTEVSCAPPALVAAAKKEEATPPVGAMEDRRAPTSLVASAMSPLPAPATMEEPAFRRESMSCAEERGETDNRTRGARRASVGSCIVAAWRF